MWLDILVLLPKNLDSMNSQSYLSLKCHFPKRVKLAHIAKKGWTSMHIGFLLSNLLMVQKFKKKITWIHGSPIYATIMIGRLKEVKIWGGDQLIEPKTPYFCNASSIFTGQRAFHLNGCVYDHPQTQPKSHLWTITLSSPCADPVLTHGPGSSSVEAFRDKSDVASWWYQD